MAGYLLRLRDEVDRLDEVRSVRRPALASVVGGVALVILLVVAGAPLRLPVVIGAATVVPLVVLLRAERWRRRERRALLRRIRLIEEGSGPPSTSGPRP